VLINNCRSLIQSFEEAHLQHVHREENFCADHLAKAGNNSMKHFMLYCNPSSFVLSQLLTDSWGVLYLDFVTLNFL
jgi:hypothetical protein